MKKIFCMLSLLMVMAVAPAAMGNEIQIYYTGYAYGDGGEFTITGLKGISPDYASTTINQFYPNSFQTFCVDTHTYFTPSNWVTGGVSYNYSISDIVLPSKNPVSRGAAWLYSRFATGKLAGYDYNGSSRQADAGQLQSAIWYFEGYIPDPNNQFVTLADSRLLKLHLDPLSAANGAYGVHAVNLYYASNGAYAQNQLVKTPEPSSILLMVFGLIGLVAFRHRFRMC